MHSDLVSLGQSLVLEQIRAKMGCGLVAKLRLENDDVSKPALLIGGFLKRLKNRVNCSIISVFIKARSLNCS